MNKFKLSLILAILVLGFVVRLYRINNPIGDWHAWRQADTSSVSRNFVKNGFDVLHPKYEDISNIQSGKDNPEGYRMVEFPIFSIFQAGGKVVFPLFSIELWGRLVSVMFSTVSALFVYLLVKKHLNERSALLSSAFFSFLPFSIYYGRTILPDGAMASAILGGIYFFDLWTSSKKISVGSSYFLLAVLFTAGALLLKPFALFFTIPMLALSYKRFGITFILKWQLWAFLILAISPLVWWRWWIYRFPEGIPVSDWLFNGGSVRFRPFFFRWILYERLIKLILGFAGLIILIPGIFKINKEKDYLFFLSFVISSILYVVIVARGNLQHDYYQIPIIPTLSIILGRGADFILKKFKSKITSAMLMLVCLLMFALSWNQVKDYFNINRQDLITAGQQADKVLPKNAKVIVPNDGDTSFLYYVNRKGWPAFEKDISEMISTLGATHMVIASPTKNDFEGFGKSYKIISSSNRYMILKLK